MTKSPYAKWTISYVQSAMDDITALDGSAKKVIKKAIEEKWVKILKWRNK